MGNRCSSDNLEEGVLPTSPQGLGKKRSRPAVPELTPDVDNSEAVPIVPGSEADPITSQGFIDHLRCFGSSHPLKKASLGIIASQLTGTQIQTLRKIFVTLDVNGDGFISGDDMREGLERAGVENLPEDFATIVESLASQKSEGLDYNSFLAASLGKKHYLDEHACWKAFNVLDRDSDGRLSREDLQHLLKSSEDGCSFLDEDSLEDVEQMMEMFDFNRDGSIGFEDFMLMMLRNCSPKARRRSNSDQWLPVKTPCNTLGGMQKNANLMSGTKAPPKLAAGVVVRINGLVSAKHLNGQSGVCKKWLPAEGRWRVVLDSGDTKVLKADNLEAQAGGAGSRPNGDSCIQAKMPRKEDQAPQLPTIPGSPMCPTKSEEYGAFPMFPAGSYSPHNDAPGDADIPASPLGESPLMMFATPCSPATRRTSSKKSMTNILRQMREGPSEGSQEVDEEIQDRVQDVNNFLRQVSGSCEDSQEVREGVQDSDQEVHAELQKDVEMTEDPINV